MSAVVTYVCTRCHAGWTAPPDTDRCPWCDRPGEERGRHIERPLR